MLGRKTRAAPCLWRRRWWGFGGVLNGHQFLRKLVPKSQPSFPEDTASCWLLDLIERCKLHRLSQGAGNDNALENCICSMCKSSSSPALSTCLPITTFQRSLLLCYITCWDNTEQNLLHWLLFCFVGFFFPFSFLINILQPRGCLQTGKHRREVINVFWNI